MENKISYGELTERISFKVALFISALFALSLSLLVCLIWQRNNINLHFLWVAIYFIGFMTSAFCSIVVFLIKPLNKLKELNLNKQIKNSEKNPGTATTNLEELTESPSFKISLAILTLFSIGNVSIFFLVGGEGLKVGLGPSFWAALWGISSIYCSWIVFVTKPLINKDEEEEEVKNIHL